MIDPGEAAARAFFNAAGGSYEIPTEPQAAPATLPPAGVPAATPEAPAAVAPAVAGEPAVVESAPDPAESFYAPVETRGLVIWDEPAATAGQFDLQAPPGLLDRSEEGQATLARLRDGLAEAGAGVTVARELFSDAIRAAQDRRWVVPRDEAEAQLRQHFGGRYEAQIGAAQALIQRAAARCPEIVPFLERTGLGNSPEFVRKLAAAASKRRGA